MRRPEPTSTSSDRIAGYRYLRAKGNSIEGGTSEILRNIIAERVLGLPGRAAVRQGRRRGRTCRDDRWTCCYTEVEEELRAAVRDLLAARSPCVRGAGPDREPPSRTTASCGGAGRRDGAGRPRRARGSRRRAARRWREVAVVLEELGRAVAPVPYLGSAVVATARAAGLRPTERPAGRGSPPASATRGAGRAVRRRAGRAGHRGHARTAARLTGTVTAVADALTADVLLVPAGRRRCTRSTPATRASRAPRWCRWT